MQEKKKNELAKKMQAQAEHAVKREQEREKMFIAPEEPLPGQQTKKKKHSKHEDHDANESKAEKKARKAEKQARKADKERSKSKKRKHADDD